MTAISTFANPAFGQIRAIKDDSGKPLFVAGDVASALGYSKPRNAVSTHCKGALKQGVPTKGGSQEVTLIPEADVYRLIMRSKLPQAEAFQDWVTEEVLPSIRKSGGYMYTNGTESPEDLMARAILLANETIQRSQRRIQEQEQQIADLAPKALFADAVATSSDSILIRELARIITQNGYKIGQDGLFEWLKENGYIIKAKGSDYNLPTLKSTKMGLMKTVAWAGISSSGEPIIRKTPRITGKGQQYFINKFLNLNN